MSFFYIFISFETGEACFGMDCLDGLGNSWVAQVSKVIPNGSNMSPTCSPDGPWVEAQIGKGAKHVNLQNLNSSKDSENGFIKASGFLGLPIHMY